MIPQTSKFKTLMWIGSTAAFIAVAIAVAASWLLYQHTITLLTENLRERLLSISITEAANLSADSIQQLNVESDWMKPEWRDVVTRLKRAKDGNPNIVFMYIFRKRASDPTQMEFVADAESIDPYANLDSDPTNDVDANHDGKIDPEGADKLQWPGQDYTEAADIPEAFQAYDVGPITVHDLYQDSYGRVLTGYAPIKDENGITVAILATDIKADDFFTVTQETLYPFIVFIIGLICIIAVLAITLIYIWRHRAQMLAKLSAELETANAQQENLLHFISHEVKGYLTKSEAGFAAIAEGDYGAAPEPLTLMAKNALADVRKGVKTVIEILDASNLKKGTVGYNKKPFDFKQAVELVIVHLKASAEEKQLTINASLPNESCTVNGDEEKIKEHVIRNLIDNAIKYTPHGTIQLELIKDAHKIRFSVKDNGVGITPEDMRRLFTEGGRGKDSIKVNVHSTGYGLFIAKTIVDAHDGKIWAESEGQGKGARFIVELPTE
jgi:signal transduction histidine kinase